MRARVGRGLRLWILRRFDCLFGDGVLSGCLVIVLSWRLLNKRVAMLCEASYME